MRGEHRHLHIDSGAVAPHGLERLWQQPGQRTGGRTHSHTTGTALDLAGHFVKHRKDSYEQAAGAIDERLADPGGHHALAQAQ